MRPVWFKRFVSIGIEQPMPNLVIEVQKDTNFTKDLEAYHSDTKHYLDACGNLLKYTPLVDIKGIDISKRNMSLCKSGCGMADHDLSGGKPVGLSNVNFGNITRPVEFGGTMIQELDWSLEWKNPLKRTDVVEEALLGQTKSLNSLNIFSGTIVNHKDFLVRGELTAPLVEAQDEQGSDEETQWKCVGCSKFFATKASLKRHYDRKKSCKELSEKPPATSNEVALPDKPYVVEWVDQMLTKAISGDSDKPYCKHCDVEFANKTNLNKHLSKSVACDKLAKQEFMNVLMGS